MNWKCKHDDGVTVIELLVSMALLVVLASIGLGTYKLLVHNGQQGVARTQVHGTHLDASSLLARDVKEAINLKVAEPQNLSVDVVRDGVCWNRTYAVTDKITVTTVYYEQEACRGPSQSKTETLVKDVIVASSKFTYFTDTNTVIPIPVDDLRTVKRISWDMSSKADGWKNALTYSGSATYTGLGDQTGTGQDALQAKRPVLNVVTGAREGRDAPELSWTNPNPAEYVSGWVVLRSANPEGKGATDADRGTWQQVGAQLPVGVTTFRDTTLPAGYAATYTVRPNLSDGTRGPESNSVVTGLRPAQVTSVAAVAAPTSIKVTWARQIGATGYDLYRDNVKVASVGDVATWTDALTYGHAHNYTVVGANRWESLISAGSQDKRTTDGHQASEPFPPTGTLRLFSTAAGAFTAPAAPTVVVTPNADWSNTFTWTPAGWTGAGPSTLAGVHRDRGWETQNKRRSTDAWAALWAETVRGTTSRVDAYTQASVGGQFRFYQARTCNSLGCGPYSAAVSALQRPAAPTCVASASAPTTRNVTVVGTPAPADAPTTQSNTYNVSREAVSGYFWNGPETTVTFTLMEHNRAHTFGQRTKNASTANGGWSDNSAACSASTSELKVWLSGGTASTRSVGARLNNTGGNNASLTVEGVQTQPSSGGGQAHTFDPLTHNTAYALTGRLTDGFNNVVDTATIRTLTLATPVLSFGSVTTRSVQVYVTCANGNSCTSGRNGDGGSGSGAVHDRLADGTTHTFYGRNSDGHNAVTSSAARATPVLAVSTPTCTATRDSQYAPTTVRFASNGSLNRTSAVASSAGTYSATATNTVTDGYNTNSRTNTCGVSVEPPPLPNSNISAKSTSSRYCSDGSNNHMGFEVRATWTAEPGTTYVATVYYLLNGVWQTRTLGTSSGVTWSVVNENAFFKYVTIRATNAYGSVDVEASVQGGGCIPI